MVESGLTSKHRAANAPEWDLIELKARFRTLYHSDCGYMPRMRSDRKIRLGDASKET